MNNRSVTLEFEAEVRRMVEAIWGLEPGECQPTHYPNDPVVKELDGIARLRDVTHLFMVTTSTRLEKAKADIRKLCQAEKLESSKAATVSKWLITDKQLDAQHIEEAKKHNVNAITFNQLKQRAFDGRSYINKRGMAAFGSARDPLNNTITITGDPYIQLPMTSTETIQSRKTRNIEKIEKPITIDEICKKINDGEIVVLTAPFGSGKSLTTYEIFKKLAKHYHKDETNRTPLCLNLREHWGQEYFDEILERHARSIGFQRKEDVVSAWRAGLTCLLLDGFDELASQTIVRKDAKNFMLESRRAALTGVRDFLTKVPLGTGVLICGRDHYFDNEDELKHSLGLTGKKYTYIKLKEFTEDGANIFLKKYDINAELPDWLPKKPLILSYLVQQNLIKEILEIDINEGYGFAWDEFIRKITERESELERAAMDATTLRNVMERLAFFARTMPSGTGPITGNDLASAYQLETEQSAGEGVLAQLQRLPGLTQRDQEAGARAFVDLDMLNALQGGAMYRYISGQFNYNGPSPLSAIQSRASDVAAYLLKTNEATSALPISIVERLSKEPESQTNNQLSADCITIAIAMSVEENNELDFRNIETKHAHFEVIDLEEARIKNISFNNCIINEVKVSSASTTKGIKFTSCLISKISGVANKAGLPSGMFDESCEIANYDNMNTNTAVMHSDLEPQVKALLTIIRKLYKQYGAGRKISALTRGITIKDVSNYIPQVLELMIKHEFARVYNNVVHPVRKNTNRAEQILHAPSISMDDLVIAVKSI